MGNVLFPEEEAPLLKAWLVKRLEKMPKGDDPIDADVLADFVLLVLAQDGHNREELTKLCEKELRELLNDENSPGEDRASPLITDLFTSLQNKSYLPSAARPHPPQLPPQVPNPNLGSAAIPLAASLRQTGSRKRSFYETGNAEFQAGRDPSVPGGRAFKQPRRGGYGGRGGRADYMNGSRGGRAPVGQFGVMQSHPFAPPPYMPQYDPHMAMDSVMPMQQMGMPLPVPDSSQRQYVGAPRQPRRRRSGKCRDWEIHGFCTRGTNCMFEHGDRLDDLQNGSLPVPSDEYDPRNATLMFSNDLKSRSVGKPLQVFQPNGNGSVSPNGTQNGKLHQRARKSRAPFSADGPVHDRSKSTIVVESIPEEKFSKEEVRGFFSQFGDILEVSMQPYKRLAIVKFDHWGAANAAYQSPKVIFDNRFVKVYWYKDDASILPPSVAMNGSTNSTMNGATNDHAPTDDRQIDIEPEIDMEEFSRKQQEAQKSYEEKQQKKQQLERQRQELEKRQKELLAKQQEEKQRLFAKLTTSQKQGDGSSSPEITFGSKGSKTPSKPSSQTEALRAQLAALEEEAKSLGIDPNAMDDTSSPWTPRGQGRGRGGYFRSRGFAPRGYRGTYRGRGGGPAAFAAYSLDNRPKKIAVSGVDFTVPEKDELLRQYLLGTGDFSDIETTPTVTQITFTDRRTAEKFYYGVAGKEIPGVGGQVEVGWVTGSAAPTTAAPKDFGASVDDVQKGDVNGDTLMGGNTDFAAQSTHEQHAQMDFDVADEDWDIQ